MGEENETPLDGRKGSMPAAAIHAIPPAGCPMRPALPTPAVQMTGVTTGFWAGCSRGLNRARWLFKPLERLTRSPLDAFGARDGRGVLGGLVASLRDTLRVGGLDQMTSRASIARPARLAVPTIDQTWLLMAYASAALRGRPGPPLRFGKTVPAGKTSKTTTSAAERMNWMGTLAISEAALS